jgi:hypothetical protein
VDMPRFKDRTGEQKINKYGQLMIIKEYRNTDNITIVYPEDGSERTTTYYHFKNGTLLNNKIAKPIICESKFHDRVGLKSLDRSGKTMIITQYRSCTDITVLFIEDNVEVKTRMEHFKQGKVSRKSTQSSLHPGYYGVGPYSGKNHIYRHWRSMMIRCYNPAELKRCPTYVGCTVCEEWHNYQNFAKWYEENFYTIEGHRMDLDKDIIIKGNKVYSPEACCFVPREINTLFTKGEKVRGLFPIGVVGVKNNKGDIAYYSATLQHKHLGLFSTPEEAFNCYKEKKEEHIRQVAEEYKDRIPKKVYDAMMAYEVEITD